MSCFGFLTSYLQFEPVSCKRNSALPPNILETPMKFYRRRQFLHLVAGAAALPAVSRIARTQAAQAQRRPVVPAVGWLSAVAGRPPQSMIGFRKGLSELGYIEGQNIAIEFRGSVQYDRLPALAADLVSRQVTVIFASATANPALAAKAATSTIPIVFATAGDPVKLGFVASLNRPGGNMTGVTFFTSTLVVKRLELVRELVPQLPIIGFLTNPTNLLSETDTMDLQAAAANVGQQIVVLNAKTMDEMEAAFATAARLGVGALLVDGDGFFARNAYQLAAIALRYKIPASYPTRAFTAAGGLMSYGDDRLESNRQAGVYVGRILKGEKPADLPVLQPKKFQFVINLKTANSLGLIIPRKLLAFANEVID